MRTLARHPHRRVSRWRKASAAWLPVLLALALVFHRLDPAGARAQGEGPLVPAGTELKVPDHLQVEPGDYLPLPVQIATPGTPATACVRLEVIPPEGWQPVPGWSIGASIGATEVSCSTPDAGHEQPRVHFWTLAVPPQATPGVHEIIVRAGEATYGIPVRVLARRHVTAHLPDRLSAARGSPLVVPMELRHRGNVEAHVQIQPLIPAGWHIALLTEGQDDVHRQLPREPVASHRPRSVSVGLEPGEIRILYWQLTPPHHITSDQGTLAFRLEVDGETDAPWLVRGQIQLLPPPPSSIPRLAPARAPAHVSLETLWIPSATGAPGSGSLLTVSRWQLTTRLPSPDPSAPGSLVLLRGRGPLLISPAEPGSRRVWGADGLVMDEFLLQTGQGWRLHRRPPPESLSPVLELHRPSLQWTDATGNLTLGVSMADPLQEQPTAPLALLRWTLPRGESASFTFSHRGGDTQRPPAYSLDWTQTLDQGRGRIGLSLGLVTAASHSPAAWAAQWRWHPSGFDASPALYGGFRWLQRDPGFEPDTPLRDGSVWIGRKAGATDVQLTADYQRLPYHGDVWRLALETQRPAASIAGAHLRLRLQRLFPWPPWAGGTEAGFRDELRWHLHRSAKAHSLSLSGRWILNPQGEWQARVNLRSRPGREGWWYWTLGQSVVMDPTMPAGRRTLWETGVGYVTRSPGGWQREVALGWPLLSEGWEGMGHWRLAITSPFQEGRRWRLAVEGGWGRGWRLGLHLSQPLSLPLPLPAPQGQLTGRLLAPPGPAGPDDWSGTILSLGGQEVMTDRDGFFRFPPLAPGRYRLEVRQLPAHLREHYQPPAPQTVEIHRGRVRHVTLELVPAARLAGQIVRSPEPSALATSMAGAGVFAGFTVEISGPGTRIRLTPDPDGRFHLSGLTPGGYRLSLWADDRAVRRAGPILTREVQLGAGEHLSLRLEVPLSSVPPITYQSHEALILRQESPDTGRSSAGPAP